MACCTFTMWSCAMRSSSVGGDARLDVGGQQVEHFGRQASGDAHAFNVGGSLDGDGHRRIIPSGALTLVSPVHHTRPGQ